MVLQEEGAHRFLGSDRSLHLDQLLVLIVHIHVPHGGQRLPQQLLRFQRRKAGHLVLRQELCSVGGSETAAVD